MTRMLLTVRLAALALIVAPALAIAQHDHGGYKAEDTKDCTFCQPVLSIQGGALFRERGSLSSPTADRRTGLVRGLVEAGTPWSNLGVFGTVEIVPKDNPAPRLNYGARAWLLPRFSRFNVVLGAGGTNRRAGNGERDAGEYVVRPWGDAGAEWTLPIHEIAIYGNVGTSFHGKPGTEFQLGARHPIAPWKLHVLP